LAILNHARLIVDHSSTSVLHAERLSFFTSRLSRHCAMVSPFLDRTIYAICSRAPRGGEPKQRPSVPPLVAAR
jgi:hypothetical protein